MGQYYVIVNLSKREYIDPSAFNESVKLRGFGHGSKTMFALAALLRLTNTSRPVGRWARDKIVIIGDYDKSGLYRKAIDEYKNISSSIKRIIDYEWKDAGLHGLGGLEDVERVFHRR